ncbi:hypothetical protein [Vibrio europaeus]|uniref:hypothetical protein n=1 Tax=Vibrio europaeus TaxID=300876 RepID=UPI00233E5886|nr:hypothetical protein [Vibrio europaeus]MDC5753537.1 hypothetical protein [Vibrio europaeus]MDC5816550.1 hypothetical protein [Vibrio europaeus]
MIGLIIFLIVAAFFALLGAAAAKAKSHGLTMLFVVLASVSTILSVAVYPLSEQIESEVRTRTEAERAKVMTKELGSADNYIRYLEAIN